MRLAGELACDCLTRRLVNATGWRANLRLSDEAFSLVAS